MSALQDLKPHYEIVVIGGGVHGAALAMEAARRGRGVLLVEKNDFCSGASANSLKIIHGGLRYLQSANVRRSRDSAREQSRLLSLAPHLVQDLPCVMGTGRSMLRSRAAMALGMWFYDNVVRLGLPGRPKGRVVTPAEANRLAGANLFDGCPGAALWHDARVRDTERLVLTYLKTAESAGARILNYVSAVNVNRGSTVSVALRAEPGGTTTGITADRVVDSASFLDPYPHWARAVNLVLSRPGPACALGLTPAGRVSGPERLFFVTPHDRSMIVGTWYFPDHGGGAGLSGDELERCVADTRTMLPHLDIARGDIQALHVGRLPVADPSRPLSLLEKPLFRTVGGDARVMSVTGVKYTTARLTAKRALRLIGIGGGPADAASRWYGTDDVGGGAVQWATGRLEKHMEADIGAGVALRLCRQYGSVAADIIETGLHTESGLTRIPGCDAIDAEIHYCIEHEHCRTLGDFLLRRSGLGSVAPVSNEAARHCADVMARRLGWAAGRRDDELARLAAHYDRVDPHL